MSGVGGVFDPAVGVTCESRVVVTVRRVRCVPRPATELGGSVVAECLTDLVVGVHHERTLLRDGLTDRSALPIFFNSQG